MVLLSRTSVWICVLFQMDQSDHGVAKTPRSSLDTDSACNEDEGEVNGWDNTTG